MGLHGSGLSDKNTRLRFFVYAFMGIAALGSLLYWRTQLMFNSEYGEVVPVASKGKHKDSADDKLKSKNYQIETFDTSPTVK